GGLSSSRNVGIEYFSKEYKLKNITNDIKENSLIEFSIEGNNPYEIYKVYKSSKFFKNENELLNFQTPNIDYIIFLDSDDYWELNCIEECVLRMDGVEVVWFDHYFFYDDIEKPEIIPQTIIQMHQYQQGKIDVKTFFKNMMNLKLDSFWFGWHGMINFKYLKKINLKFLNQVLHEDHYFGKLLFFQLNNIYIFPKKLLYYRIRKGSIMNYSNEKSYIPEYALDDYKILEENYFTYKQYHRNSSLFLTALMVFNFIDKYNNHDDLFNQIFLNKLKTWRDELLNFNPKYLNIVLYLSFSKLFKLSNNVDKNLKLISNFIKDNIIIKNTQINNLESNINNLESNINNLESELKICKHISNFHSLYGTAK
ncbi:glycosyltransferase family 2 protein, partial [Campylobacter molothri]|uniref:glycosyltransferase family 2 protein n=1 Tax=Campylobacter molothri TaxID=1032242 RepID=UPI001DD264CD|nr:glycosyltransferase family 2 protein [Campylobacter sp. RM12397]